MALALVELFSYRRQNWLCKVVQVLDYILMFTKYRDFPYVEIYNDFVFKGWLGLVGSVQVHSGHQDVTIHLGKNMGPPYQLAMPHFNMLLSFRTRTKTFSLTLLLFICYHSAIIL